MCRTVRVPDAGHADRLMLPGRCVDCGNAIPAGAKVWRARQEWWDVDNPTGHGRDIVTCEVCMDAPFAAREGDRK